MMRLQHRPEGMGPMVDARMAVWGTLRPYRDRPIGNTGNT